MKKSFTLFVVFIFHFSFFIFHSKAQVPYWKWAKHAGGASYDEATAMLRNNAGNLTVAGTFRGTAYFPADTITPSLFTNMFIAEYGLDGTNLSVKHIAECTGEIVPGFIFQDADSNYYIVGTFGTFSSGGTVTFFPSTSFTSAGNQDIFVAKFDAAGNLRWAHSI